MWLSHIRRNNARKFVELTKQQSRYLLIYYSILMKIYIYIYTWCNTTLIVTYSQLLALRFLILESTFTLHFQGRILKIGRHGQFYSTTFFIGIFSTSRRDLSLNYLVIQQNLLSNRNLPVQAVAYATFAEIRH